MGNLPREQAFDETIKNLEAKDFKTLAGLAIPNIAEAEDISLQFAELAMADMKKQLLFPGGGMREETIWSRDCGKNNEGGDLYVVNFI